MPDAMRLLGSGVPLSLLLDLVAVEPDSVGICLAERPPQEVVAGPAYPRMA